MNTEQPQLNTSKSFNEKTSVKLNVAINKGSSRISAKAILLPYSECPSSHELITTTIGKIIPRQKIIILSPKYANIHSANYFLSNRKQLSIPLNKAKLDATLTKAILSNKKYPLSGSQEYISKKMLSTLQHFFKKSQLTLIKCQNCSLGTYREISTQMFEALKHTHNDTLLIALADLATSNSEATVRKIDRLLIDAIINLNDDYIIEKIKTEKLQMLGEASLLILLNYLKMTGIKKTRVNGYKVRTIADKKHPFMSGHAGIIFQ